MTHPNDARTLCITWIFGYGESDGNSETHPREWFADDNGFDADDIAELDALTIGEVWNGGGFLNSVEVKRVS